MSASLGEFTIIRRRLKRRVMHLAQPKFLKMKITPNWLRQYVDFNWSPAKPMLAPAGPSSTWDAGQALRLGKPAGA